MNALISPSRRRSTRTRGAAVTTIVVGYDETDAARRALARAADFARAFGAKVIITSVARPSAPAARGIGPEDPVDTLQQHREELAHAEAFLTECGIEGEYDLALADPATHIVRLAGEREADLIVVGTREPSLVAHLMGLSVSDAVNRKAHCDVLIVH